MNREEAKSFLASYGCLYISKTRNLGRCYNEYQYIFYINKFNWDHIPTREKLIPYIDYFKVNDQGGTSVSESDVKLEGLDWHRVELTYTVDSSD